MPTNLGTFLRKLRINRNESLKMMADKLNVSCSFLSAVENGKKKMPAEWLKKIDLLYSLNPEELQQFIQAAASSMESVRLDLRHANPDQKELAVLFARQTPDLSEQDAQKILKLINTPRLQE